MKIFNDHLKCGSPVTAELYNSDIAIYCLNCGFLLSLQGYNNFSSEQKEIILFNLIKMWNELNPLANLREEAKKLKEFLEKRCPSCEGSGKRSIPVKHCENGIEGIGFRPIDCEACSGTGKKIADIED